MLVHVWQNWSILQGDRLRRPKPPREREAMMSGSHLISLSRTFDRHCLSGMPVAFEGVGGMLESWLEEDLISNNSR